MALVSDTSAPEIFSGSSGPLNGFSAMRWKLAAASSWALSPARTRLRASASGLGGVSGAASCAPDFAAAEGGEAVVDSGFARFAIWIANR